MMRQRLVLGIDTSKGYGDFCFQDALGRTLPGSDRYDDTPAGHTAVRQRVAQLLAAHPEAELLVGIEASGGLERNWLQLFRQCLPAERSRIYQLNPLVVKRFLARDLHRNVTDAQSARGIADYLRNGLRTQDLAYTAEDVGLLTLYRNTCNLLDQGAMVKNELQSLLPSVHPDLVAFCREGMPKWILRLLEKYPTVAQLQAARPATVARLPYITLERATSLVQAAKKSVASLRDAHTGQVVAELAEEILRLEKRITLRKQHLISLLKDDAEVQLIDSVIGIGTWTAVALRLEYGSFTRFHHAAAAVAFAGLDPRRRESGDSQAQAHISRHGRSGIRAALYMAALTAIRDNPPMQEFYRRLKDEGKGHKVALTACMAKLIRIAYTCVVSETPFSVDRHNELQAKRRRSQAERSAAAPSAEPVIASESTRQADVTVEATLAVGAMSAPVSRREAKKRKAATAPQVGHPQRVRGHGTASPQHDKADTTAKPSRELSCQS